ncbi:LysR family transcriptional regulator [Lentibacillus sp. N15]|uniref:LysR family transcriptional regulator n=1 Tax=Lentibacillus songyuanensis TaxID=3136161 RepID=UPI0031BAE871
MNKKDWVLLITLFKEKNITKTAERLYISQPTLTYRLKQLEKELNITILFRGRRGVEFSEQGEILVRYCEEMLFKYRDLQEELANSSQFVRGTLNLGVSRAIAIYTLPKILKQFHQTFPEVEFRVSTGLNPDLVNSVYKQDFHVGIVRGDHHWSGEKHILTKENISIISEHPIDVNQLPKLSRIDYQTDPTLIMAIDNWWKDSFSEPPKITMKVDNMEIAKRMITAGLGYTIVPNIVLEENDQFYTYDLKDEENQPIKWTTWILYRKEALNLSAVSEFAKFVKKYYI